MKRVEICYVVLKGWSTEGMTFRAVVDPADPDDIDLIAAIEKAAKRGECRILARRPAR